MIGWVLLLISCGKVRPVPALPAIDSSRFQGDVGKAIEQALGEAKANPANADRALRLGMVLHAHQQFQTAGQCYSRAYALDPKRFATLYYWGHTLASDGAYGPAAERLKNALAIRPDSVPALLKLAEVLRESGDASQSAGIYNRILGSADNALAHYGLGRTLAGDAAVEEFRRALALFPRYGAAQFALAAAYRRQGAEAKAQELLRDYERDKTLLPPLDDPEMTAIRALNVSPTALLQRAGEQELEGRLEEALSLYQRAIAADPKLVQAYVDLISLYGRLQRQDEAEQAYRKAIALNPNHAGAHYNFGVFCFERNRLGEAKAAFDRAIRIQPRHAEALNNLGAVLEGEGKWEPAAALYRRAVDARSAYPLAHFHLGRIYANQKKYALALKELERSLEPVSESTPTYLYALAATHARAGNRARAAELMRDARRKAEAQGQRAVLASIDRDLALLERKP